MAEKTKTYIEGFDALIEDGLPKGCSILLCGTPGTGKTIFALEYLYNGAVHSNEKSLYITFEENADNLRKQARQFGWNLEELEKKGKLTILDIAPKSIIETTGKDIISRVQKGKYDRLVIDSLSALAINTPNTFGSVTDITEISIRRFVYHFISELRATNATTLFISQTPDERKFSNDGVSEFICDGIIHLRFETLGGNFSRSLLVRKMRKVKNDEDLHPFEIGSKGINIHNLR